MRIAALLAAALAIQNPALAQQSIFEALDPAITKQPRISPKSAGPEYPAKSIQKKEEGSALLKLCISAKGRVTSSEIVQSSGYARLDKATLDWMKAATFEPAEAQEQPVAVCNVTLAKEWKFGGRKLPN